MKHIRLFETQEQYDEVSYKLDYPCISLIEDETDGSLIYEDEPSWIKCTYEIPQEALDGGTTSFTIMNNAKSVVKAYKINGEIVDIEPIKVEEGVAVEVFQPMEMEGAGTVYMPSLDACPLAETLTTATTFNISRQVDVTSDYLLMVIYEGDTLAGLEPIPIAEAGTESLDMYYTFSEDGLSYSYADTLIQQLGTSFAGYGFGMFIIDADYAASFQNNGSVNPPSITTTMVGRKISGGLKNIEVDQSVLGEDNRCVIEYKLKNDVTQITDKFNNLNYLKEIDFSGLKTNEPFSIASGAFRSNTNLESAIFNKSNLRINEYAFEDCSSLNYVDLSKLTDISSYAFQGCTSLINITIPQSLSTITFLKHIPNITELSFEDGYTDINSSEYSNFSGLTNLTSVVIPDSVTSIGNYAFYKCTKLTNIHFSNRLQSIGRNAFYYCTSLTSLVIPDSVITVGQQAFYTCSGLTNIHIGSGITQLSNHMFAQCYSLTYINIPNNVTHIDSSVFYGCRNLTSITIPDSVTSIAKMAFYMCSSLKNITCKATTCPSIGSSTFETMPSNGTLYYPKGSDYSSWMRTDAYYLGYYNWTSQEVEF